MPRILVADDDDVIQTVVRDTLEAAGHEVDVAADGVAALARLGAGEFDALITDLQMPGLTGIELLRQVRADRPELPVIMMTAHASVETAVEAMKAGAFDYLQKPLRAAEIKLVVARALEHRELVAFRDRVRRDQPALAPLTHGAPAMVPVIEALKKVAPTNATVLLTGESGTGKEIAARTIHQWSKRADAPFVAVNCAALAESLLESELFGHEKGAFTGAQTARQGRLELARGGTFFLDEIGELKPDLQIKLLRIIQERAFERVGGNRTIAVDVRWVAATNADLPVLVRDGAFREDLYHRLAVFPLRIPALRERREDVLPLARLLLERIAADLGRPAPALDAGAESALVEAPWTGNVRELRNALERAAIMSDGATVTAEDLALDARAAAGPAPRTARLEELERETIAKVLSEEGGNRRRTAERLGVALRTLYNKLQKYGL